MDQDGFWHAGQLTLHNVEPPQVIDNDASYQFKFLLQKELILNVFGERTSDLFIINTPKIKIQISQLLLTYSNLFICFCL